MGMVNLFNVMAVLSLLSAMFSSGIGAAAAFVAFAVFSVGGAILHRLCLAYPTRAEQKKLEGRAHAQPTTRRPIDFDYERNIHRNPKAPEGRTH